MFFQSAAIKHHSQFSISTAHTLHSTAALHVVRVMVSTSPPFNPGIHRSLSPTLKPMHHPIPYQHTCSFTLAGCLGWWHPQAVRHAFCTHAACSATDYHCQMQVATDYHAGFTGALAGLILLGDTI